MSHVAAVITSSLGDTGELRCGMCGGPATGGKTGVSTGFSDWDQLAAGRWPEKGNGGLCSACARAYEKTARYTRQPPKGFIGWLMHHGEVEAIPGGLGGLARLIDPPEPPFVCLIGKWRQLRHHWLRAAPALDRSLYPVLLVTSGQNVPLTQQTVWMSASRAADLRQRLVETKGDPWRVLRGPLPKEPAARDQAQEIRRAFEGRPGTESGLLIRVATASAIADVADQEEDGEEEEG